VCFFFPFGLTARSHIRTFADGRDITVARMRKRQDKEEKHIIRMSRLMSGMAKKGGAVALRGRAHAKTPKHNVRNFIHAGAT